MSTGVIFILGKGGSPILASGVKSTWPQGSSAPGFSILSLYLYSTDLFVPSASNENLRMKGSEHEYMLPQASNGIADFKRYSYPLLLEWQSWRPVAHICF